MRDPLAGLPEQARERAVAAEQPSWTNPMLATLTDRRFSDPGWVFEPNFDGERCLVFRKGPQVRLLSRNRKRLNDHYPELAEALAAQEADDFVVDGEVVAFQRGRSSFARLQRRMQLGDPQAARRSGVAVYLYLFDVLHVHGQELTRLGRACPAVSGPTGRDTAWTGDAAGRLPLVQGLVLPRGWPRGRHQAAGHPAAGQAAAKPGRRRAGTELRAFLDRDDTDEADAAHAPEAFGLLGG
jgi:hypothetical protein